MGISNNLFQCSHASCLTFATNVLPSNFQSLAEPDFFFPPTESVQNFKNGQTIALPLHKAAYSLASNYCNLIPGFILTQNSLFRSLIVAATFLHIQELSLPQSLTPL